MENNQNTPVINNTPVIQRYYLVGFMGSGKSTYGRKLAQILGYSFTDLDQVIEEKTGKTVQAIFEEEGEDKFREYEASALRETQNLQKTVIATGGGTPCFHGNMDWMNSNGTTIYLKLLEEELFKRLSADKEERPLLFDKEEQSLREFIFFALKKRAVYYAQAKITIYPPQLAPEELALIMSAETSDN